MPLQVAALRERLPALLATERPRARVRVFMLLQLRRGNEPLLAQLAHVRLLSGVDTPVLLQIAELVKTLLARIARVRFHVEVDFLVLLQLRAAYEALGADVAPERSLLAVQHPVLFQIARFRERLRADFAPERLNPRVRYLVVVQLRGRDEAFRTDLAPVRPLARVQPPMLPQVAELGECFIARLARQMGRRVVSQVVRRAETPFAYFTRERLDACMDVTVRFQIANGQEQPVAVVAFVRFPLVVPEQVLLQGPQRDQPLAALLARERPLARVQPFVRRKRFRSHELPGADVAFARGLAVVRDRNVEPHPTVGSERLFARPARKRFRAVVLPLVHPQPRFCKSLPAPSAPRGQSTVVRLFLVELQLFVARERPRALRAREPSRLGVGTCIAADVVSRRQFVPRLEATQAELERRLQIATALRADQLLVVDLVEALEANGINRCRLGAT